VATIYGSEAALQKSCEFWQEKLRLQDWEIKCFIKRAADMMLENSQGAIDWVLQSKQANIHILNPIDYPSETWAQDMEKTLVHELIHLHYASFTNDIERGSIEHAFMEQSIDLLAVSLVNLKRG
jgi:hypothetical protein